MLFRSRVVVFASGEKAQEAEAAGADHVGSDELVNKITKENWLDFDVAIATPDLMSLVGKLGKILGPRGLMPSPKVGTVTFDVAKMVKEAKAGRIKRVHIEGRVLRGETTDGKPILSYSPGVVGDPWMVTDLLKYGVIVEAPKPQEEQSKIGRAHV